MISFLKKLIAYFDTEEIPYMLSGSVAMRIYALPRFISNFTFIVHLHLKDILGLMKSFKEGY